MKKIISMLLVTIALILVTPYQDGVSYVFASAKDDGQVSPNNEHEKEPDPYPTN